MNNNEISNGIKAAGCLGLAILFVGFLTAVNAISMVPTGSAGVVLRFGAYEGKNLPPGLNFKTPFVESVVKMDVRVQKVESGAQAATKDLQDVSATVALNYSLDVTKVGEIFSTLNRDAENRVIAPGVQEAVKAATAKFTAEELITKRSEVRESIKVLLTEKLTQYHIVVVDFNIVNFNFSPSFNRAIEEKVTAEQNALASKNKLEQTKYEAEQTVVSAKAQAESIRIQAEAIQQQGGENYVQLQAIAKWDGKLPTQFVPGSALPFVQLK